MSYQEYPNYGWLLKATRENAYKLGIQKSAIEEYFGKQKPEEDDDDWWYDALTDAGYDYYEFE